ncbi:exodeoxyribonuclease VII small subunit [Patescibacteria group bacterium]|nr:exodeoxyribonuclease VII small subunit [Patescibacteria group bacterium]
MTEKKSKSDIASDLNDLQKIVEWFESREDVDVEEGLKKVKEGSLIVKRLRARIKDVENDFEILKKDLKN